jgi:5'-nucleotidase
MPLRLRQAGPKRFAVGHADRLRDDGGHHIMKDHLSDLVLRGQPRFRRRRRDLFGHRRRRDEVRCSAFLPALSQAVGGRDRRSDLELAEVHGPPLVKRLVEIGWPKDILLNINFPPVAPSKVKRVAVVVQGQRDQSMLRVVERVDARGRTYFWIGFKRIFSDPERGTDLHAIAEGNISVTPLHLNLTELREHQRLSTVLDGPIATLKRKKRGLQRVPRASSSSGRSRRTEILTRLKQATCRRSQISTG